MENDIMLNDEKAVIDKKKLRQEIRKRKKEFSPKQLQIQSKMILQKLEAHPFFQTSRRVMLYASLPDEVQTMDFINEWKTQKRIILPTVKGDDIVPVELAPETTFVEGDFHILEPENKPYNETIDLVVVPGMAFDRDGHRLGRGRGYYDRFLLKYPDAKTIGICFDFQLVESIPIEMHDHLVDVVITL